MADGSFPTLVSKDTGANAVANPIWIELTDGSTAIGVTSNALDVNVANTSITIGDLVAGVAAGEDNILIFANTVKDGSGTDYVPLVDSDGQLQVDVLTAPAVRTITKASDSIQVSKDTNVNSSTNPIYVAVTTDVISATEIHDYGTTVDTGNNDYTVTGTTFLLKSVIFAASGGMKAEVQVGPIGTLVTKAVGFIPHQGGTFQMEFNPPIEVPVTSTGTVRVVMTNREGSAQSVYSTIIGNDIP
jgi:hypothetical protein